MVHNSMQHRITVVRQYVSFHTIYEIDLVYFNGLVDLLVRVQLIRLNKRNRYVTLRGSRRSCSMVDVGGHIPEVWILLLNNLSSFIDVGDPLNRFFNCWHVLLNFTKKSVVEWRWISIMTIYFCKLFLI